MKNSIVIGCLLASAALLSSGCASQKSMQTSARNAADQLAAVKLEVDAKARAEAEYYRQEKAAMADVLHKARLDDFELLLKKKAETFKPSTDIETFLTGFLDAWQKKDGEREAEIQKISAKLAEVEITLDARAAEFDALEKKLRVLSEAPTKKELAKFAAGFVEAAYTEYEAAKGASGN